MPVVSYRYEVDGVGYEGAALSHNGRISAFLRTRFLMPGRFRYTGPVQVWYDPANPSRSVLEPGIDPWSVGGVVGGVTLLCIAAFLWLAPA